MRMNIEEALRLAATILGSRLVVMSNTGRTTPTNEEVASELFKLADAIIKEAESRPGPTAGIL